MILSALNRRTNKYENLSFRDLGAYDGYFTAFIAPQAVGAAVKFFDLFNTSTSTVNLIVDKVVPIVDGSVAVTGAVTVNMQLQRTTSVGTGGTAVTPGKHDTTTPNLPANVTCRRTPTGGAALGADVLGFASLYTDEQSPGPHSGPLINSIEAPIIVRPNSGLCVVQGAVASVGSLAFLVGFRPELIAV